jgi:hypothetical protein
MELVSIQEGHPRQAGLEEQRSRLAAHQRRRHEADHSGYSSPVYEVSAEELDNKVLWGKAARLM